MAEYFGVSVLVVVIGTGFGILLKKNLSAIVLSSEWRNRVKKKSVLFLRIQTKPLRSYHLAYGNILKMKCGRKFKT